MMKIILKEKQITDTYKNTKNQVGVRVQFLKNYNRNMKNSVKSLYFSMKVSRQSENTVILMKFTNILIRIRKLATMGSICHKIQD